MLTVILAFIGIVAAFVAAMPTSPAFSTTVDIANTNINRDVNPNPGTFWQVRVQTFTEDLCHGAYTFLWLDPDVCINFNADVKSLRVVGHDGPVKYNSRESLVPTYFAVASSPSCLRCHVIRMRGRVILMCCGSEKADIKIVNVYTSLGCQTGPTVQPVLSRKCYQKEGYLSIKLRT
jgi:hypothetical protein